MAGARGILSKEEIEALLRPDFSDLDAPEPPLQVEAAPLKSFSESDTYMDEAQRMSAALSLAFRSDCKLEAVCRPLGARKGRFTDGASVLPQQAGVLCFADARGQISAMLSFETRLANCFVEIACGGDPARSTPRERQLTSLDADLLTEMFAPAAPVFGSGSRLARVETRSSFAAALAPAGEALIVDLQVSLCGAAFRAVLIVGAPMEHAPAAVLKASEPKPLSDVAPSGTMTVLTARLANLSVPASRLARLRPGETLLLGLPPDQPVSLLSGGRDGPLAAEGEIGRKGAKMAVRIMTVKPR